MSQKYISELNETIDGLAGWADVLAPEMCQRSLNSSIISDLLITDVD